jgi:hypothetical protein
MRLAHVVSNEDVKKCGGENNVQRQKIMRDHQGNKTEGGNVCEASNHLSKKGPMGV